VPALHDVERYAIEVDTGAARHEGMLARKYIEPGPFKFLDKWYTFESEANRSALLRWALENGFTVTEVPSAACAI
jgi:hypothetical protein